MSKIDRVNVSNSAELNARFEVLRNELKGIGYTMEAFATEVQQEFPEFNSVEGVKKITAAWFLRTPNIFLVDIAQEMLKNMKG